MFGIKKFVKNNTHILSIKFIQKKKNLLTRALNINIKESNDLLHEISCLVCRIKASKKPNYFMRLIKINFLFYLHFYWIKTVLRIDLLFVILKLNGQYNITLAFLVLL